MLGPHVQLRYIYVDVLRGWVPYDGPLEEGVEIRDVEIYQDDGSLPHLV